MTSKAQAAKNKGNEAFKEGDYFSAIGHYTSAILADGNDYTFPLNRAAAYLKLGKDKDAERDCTTVLSLDASNVKALFRRGQARLRMGRLREAQQDLTDALKRDPANEAVKEELKSVVGLLEKQNVKKAGTPTIISSPQSSPKRRRIPITIVDSDDINATPSQPVLQPQSQNTTPNIVTAETRSISKKAFEIENPSQKLQSQPTLLSSPAIGSSPVPPTPIKPPTHPEKPHDFKEAKRARESTKPSQVGGGIFRANGGSTIFPTRRSSVSNTASTPAPPAVSPVSTSVSPASTFVPVLPSSSGTTSLPTLFDFTKAWNLSLTTNERWNLILTVSPVGLPTLFKTSLEPGLMVAILQVFLEKLQDENMGGLNTTIKEYMENLSRVPRFGTVVMLMSKKEKEIARGVWEGLGVNQNVAGAAWRTVW